MTGTAHAHHHGGMADPPGGHGMAVVGEQAVYCSHLPMFMSPHDYQVIAEVEFEGDARQRYLDDRAAHPEQLLYTFNPREFVLPDLFPDGDVPARLAEFRGTLHRGHFERGDTNPVEIAGDVTARVRRVIHQHKLDPGAEEAPDLQYLLFGTPAEMFLAHLITGPPSFDHLLTVEVDEPFLDTQLARGMVVTFDGLSDEPESRIRPGTDTELAGMADIGRTVRPVRIRPLTEYYFEAGELAEAR